VTKYYVKKLAFTRACLSYVRVIMVIMRVPLVDSLCQAVIGRIPAPEYMLSGACGLLWPHPVTIGTKCHSFLRSGAGSAYSLSRALRRVD
jgi:hypothetical protein